MRDEAGTLISFQGITRDITERKSAEVELRESEERYRLIFEGSAEGIIMADAESQQIHYANPAICRMLGYSEKEMREKNVSDIHPPSALPLVNSKFDSMLKEERVLTLPLPLLRKDGNLLHAEFSGALVNIKGRRYGVGFFTDITERNKAEQKRLQLLRRLEGLYVLQDMLLMPMPLSKKLQLIADMSVELLKLDSSQIWLIGPGDQCNSGCVHAAESEEGPTCLHRERCLHPLAESGASAPAGDENRRVPIGRFAIGRIAAGEMEKYSADDFAADSPHCAGTDKFGVRFLRGLPPPESAKRTGRRDGHDRRTSFFG